MNRDITIEAISFIPGGVAIQWSSPSDLRVEGQVAVVHEARLGEAHPDYGEDIKLLHQQAKRTLLNALEDWEGSEPYDPREDEDEDQGMGF